MKVIIHALLILLPFSNSCESQEKEQIFFNYYAQTRGFVYSLQLKNNEIELNNNGLVKKISLTEQQYNELYKLFSEINFKKIKSNISTDDLAVDKAIKAICSINMNEKLYSFEFDHNNLPKEIQSIKLRLEKFLN